MAGGVFADVHRPALDAGLRVERDQIAVERADVDRVVEDGDAAVDAREAEVQHARRDRPRPFPQRLAALQIERATIVGPDVTYIMPLATIGVDSTAPVPGG